MTRMKTLMTATALSAALMAGSISAKAADIVDTAVSAGSFKHARGRGPGRRPRRHAEGRRPVHRVRADR
jgi:hypothetical protein